MKYSSLIQIKTYCFGKWQNQLNDNKFCNKVIFFFTSTLPRCRTYFFSFSLSLSLSLSYCLVEFAFLSIYKLMQWCYKHLFSKNVSLQLNLHKCREITKKTEKIMIEINIIWKLSFFFFYWKYSWRILYRFWRIVLV